MKKIMLVFGTRAEAVNAEMVKLVETDNQAILDHVTTMLTDLEAYNKISKTTNPCRDGKEWERIVGRFLA